MNIKKCVCGSEHFQETGFGLEYCLVCGTARSGAFGDTANIYWRQDRVMPKQYYTRLKRFKKYLKRASREQSVGTVPQETWEYLLARGPYRSARHVQLTLKAARNLKRKCYDSLPLLTASLCPDVKVPSLMEFEKRRAIELFGQIDRAVGEGPFISYLFCLEYILRKMGRSDMCPFLNRIQCNKRRADYQRRLDTIFEEGRPDPSNFFRKRSRTPS
jgi:hypothetical protein